MVAYSFKKRFAEPIIEGTKRQTIRARGKRRHAQPGDKLQLYVGMRTKHCRKIKDATCKSAHEIKIDWRSPFAQFWIDGRKLIERQRYEFIAADGFESVADMRSFWKDNHPGVDVFHGVLIRW